MIELEYGLKFWGMRDLDGHYTRTSRVLDFPFGTLEAAQAEAKKRNAGRCIRDRCINTSYRCGNPGQPHIGYYTITKRGKRG